MVEVRLYRYAAGVLIGPERECDVHFFRPGHFHGERVCRHPIDPGVYLEGCVVVAEAPCAYRDVDVPVLEGAYGEGAARVPGVARIVEVALVAYDTDSGARSIVPSPA